MENKKTIFLADKISSHHIKLIEKLSVNVINKPGLSAKDFKEAVQTNKPHVIGKIFK